MILFICKRLPFCPVPVKLQGGSKNAGHRRMTIILSNLNRFQNFFTGRFTGKFSITILDIPPPLAYVATLPCETLMYTVPPTKTKVGERAFCEWSAPTAWNYQYRVTFAKSQTLTHLSAIQNFTF